MKIILALFLTVSSLGAFGSARIIFVKGDVKLANKTLKKNDVLNIGQTIKSSKNSFAVLDIDKMMKFKLEPSSELTIEHVKVSKKEATLLLKAGAVFLNVIPKKENKIKLKTKSVVMGVRGTQFFTAYGKANSKAFNDLWMCVKEGKVEVLSGATKQLVKKGEGIFINKGTLITKPKAYKWTENLNWQMEGNEKEIENKVDILSQYDDLEDFDYD